MKKWLGAAAGLAICTGGIAVGVSMAPGKSENVDTTLDGGQQELVETTVDVSERTPPKEIDAAIEDRTATLFLCPNADTSDLVRLATLMSKADQQHTAMAKENGCTVHEGPTSFGGPMASMDKQYGAAVHSGAISYLGGSFSLANPGSSGSSALGIVRWDTGSVAAPANDRVALEAYLDFVSTSNCEPGPSLTRIRNSVYEDGSAFIGPYKTVEAQKVGPDKDDITRRTLPIAGTWHGLPVKAIRFVGQDDSGISWMEFVFDAPADTVGAVMGRLGFGVRKIGDVVEKTVNDVELTISLTRERNTTVLTCDASN